MVDLVILQSISYIVAALGVCLAAIYYVLTLRNTNKNMKATLETRQAQLFLAIYQRSNDLEFRACWTEIQLWEWKDTDDFMRKYGPRTNLEAWRKMGVVGSYLEGIGVLVKRGLIDVKLVDDLISTLIIYYWQKFGPIIIELRKAMGPQTSEFAEYLYNEVMKVYEQQHPGVIPKPM